MKNFKTYFSTPDIKEYYIALNGSMKGFNAFLKDTRSVATKTMYGYQYRDEEALFQLFKKRFPKELEARGITCWNMLVARVNVDDTSLKNINREV